MGTACPCNNSDRPGAVTGPYDLEDYALFPWNPAALLQGCLGPPGGERGHAEGPGGDPDCRGHVTQHRSATADSAQAPG